MSSWQIDGCINIVKKSSANNNYSRLFVRLSFACYALILCFNLFLNGPYRVIGRRSFNLVPFKTINAMISNYGYIPDVAIVNLVGNVMAFAPFGFFMPIIFRKVAGIRKILLIGVGASLSAELIQFTFRLGAFDVDDIILNTIGTILGYVTYRAVVTLWQYRVAVKDNA